MKLSPRARANLHAPLMMAPACADLLARELNAPSGAPFLSRLLPRRPHRASELSAIGRPMAEMMGPPQGASSADWVNGFRTMVADGVALVSVQGVLHDRSGWCDELGCWIDGYDGLVREMEWAAEAEEAGAIFLRVASPGGLSSGMTEGVEAIEALSARKGGKPIVCHVQSLAASAGYGIAMAADELYASRDARIGSIGSIVVHTDHSVALSRAGIKVTAVSSGARKPDGHPAFPVSDTYLATMEAYAGHVGGGFVQAVMRLRGLSEADVLAQEGELFTATHADPAFSALARGLIDAVMTERAAFERARTLSAEYREGKSGVVPVALPSPEAVPAQSMALPVAAGVQQKGSMMKALTQRLQAAMKAEEGSAPEEVLAKIKAVIEEAEASGEDDEAGASGEEGDEATGETDEEAAARAQEEEEAAARAEDEKAKAASDDDKASSHLPSATTILAIVRCKEANGRSELAAALAETPGMTVERARSILSKAGSKGFPGKVVDPDVKPDGGSSNAATEIDRMADQAVALAGVGARK